jgi:hypothetical protein
MLAKVLKKSSRDLTIGYEFLKNFTCLYSSTGVITVLQDFSTIRGDDKG